MQLTLYLAWIIFELTSVSNPLFHTNCFSTILIFIIEHMVFASALEQVMKFNVSWVGGFIMQLPLNRIWITTLLAFFSVNLGRQASLQISSEQENKFPHVSGNFVTSTCNTLLVLWCQVFHLGVFIMYTKISIKNYVNLCPFRKEEIYYV